MSWTSIIQNKDLIRKGKPTIDEIHKKMEKFRDKLNKEHNNWKYQKKIEEFKDGKKTKNSKSKRR